MLLRMEPTMKSLARPSFFRFFDLLLGTTNPGLKLLRWTHDSVEFERERHSFTGPRLGLTIEIVMLARGGRCNFCLLVCKEYWWAGAESKPFKQQRWARQLSGQRADLFAWLRDQEAALEHSSPSVRGSVVSQEAGWEEDNDEAAEEIVTLPEPRNSR
jgi:hypothetical protein